MIIRIIGGSPEIIMLPSKVFGGISIEIKNNKVTHYFFNTLFKKGSVEATVFTECANNLIGLTQDEAVNLIKTYLLCFGLD